MPDEHLTTEEISALLDRGAEQVGESGHLAECAACRREMELLRRMRMALSALDDRKAPRGAWASIEAELDERDSESDGGDEAPRRTSAFGVGDIGWLRAAAAVVLFVGGLGLGTVIGSPDGPPAEGAPEEAVAAADRSPDEAAGTEETAATGRSPAARDRSDPAPDASGDGTSGAPRPGAADADGLRGDPGAGGPASGGAPVASVAGGTASDAAGGSAAAGADPTYREVMERLERLRDRGPTIREAYRNPEAAAEHLARLEALMRASREALMEDPADPALNDFLFRVAEERAAYDRALRLSKLEYR